MKSLNALAVQHVDALEALDARAVALCTARNLPQLFGPYGDRGARRLGQMARNLATVERAEHHATMAQCGGNAQRNDVRVDQVPGDHSSQPLTHGVDRRIGVREHPKFG